MDLQEEGRCEGGGSGLAVDGPWAFGRAEGLLGGWRAGAGPGGLDSNGVGLAGHIRLAGHVRLDTCGVRGGGVQFRYSPCLLALQRSHSEHDSRLRESRAARAPPGYSLN